MFGFDDALMGDILLGAAIGGGVNLLTGKNPLQGAALGGVGGGLLNGFKGANFLQGSAAKTISTNAVPGSLESMGMKTIGETAYNPEYFAGLGFGKPIYTGSEGLLSQLGTGAGSIWDSAKANLPDYVTPQNVLGAANVLSSMQSPQQQLPSAQSSMRPGSTQGLNVNFGMAQPIPVKRRMA